MFGIVLWASKHRRHHTLGMNVSITFSFHEEKTGFPESPSGWAVDILSRVSFSAAQLRIGLREHVWRMLVPWHCLTVTAHQIRQSMAAFLVILQPVHLHITCPCSSHIWDSRPPKICIYLCCDNALLLCPFPCECSLLLSFFYLLSFPPWFPSFSQ